MRSLRTSVSVVVALLALVSAGAAAQAPSAPPCRSAPEYRQLDFWIGEWSVTNATGQPMGESSIQQILGDCIVFENWKGATGFAGKSFNLFNRRSRKWEQTWVDAVGMIRKFSGEFREGKLHYVAEDVGPQGQPILVRMILSPEGKDHVRQLSEWSGDGGSTWQPRYDFLYTRRASAHNSGLSAADMEGIRAVMQGYTRAWLEGKPEAVMAALLDDAVIMPHHGVTPREGAAAIRQFWWPPNSPPTRITDFRMTPDEISGGSELAYARGRFNLTYTMQQDGVERAVSNAGTFLLITRKNAAGEWRISRFMWDDPPAQAR